VHRLEQKSAGREDQNYSNKTQLEAIKISKLKHWRRACSSYRLLSSDCCCIWISALVYLSSSSTICHSKQALWRSQRDFIVPNLTGLLTLFSPQTCIVVKFFILELGPWLYIVIKANISRLKGSFVFWYSFLNAYGSLLSMTVVCECLMEWVCWSGG
jgi:hypothetical protein